MPPPSLSAVPARSLVTFRVALCHVKHAMCHLFKEKMRSAVTFFERPRTMCCAVSRRVAYVSGTTLKMTAEEVQPGDGEKKVTVHVRLTPSQKAEVENWAEVEERDLSSFVRWWLKQYPKLRREKAGGN